MAMNSEGNNVNEGKQFAFDLNVEAVDESFDLNVEPVDGSFDLNVEAVDESFDLNVEPVDVSFDLNDVEVVDEENRDSPDDSDSCTICLEPVVNNNDDHRTIVTLKCHHKFHLDCIGSAFNEKNLMQCPNCRNIEPGQWWLPNRNEDDEENDPGFFSTDVIIRSELCPFEGLAQHYSVGGQHCLYVECSFFITQSFFNTEVTESSDSSSQGNTDTGEVPNPNGLPVEPLSYRSPYPLFPHIPLPPNRRIFWRALQPGVMRARHYISHPFCNHSPFGRSDISMVNAPMAPSYPSSSTPQTARGISDPWLISYGSNQVNSIGFNPFDIWESGPFLEPRQQHMIESDFYSMIYGNGGGRNDNSGDVNGSRGGSGSHGGHASDRNSGTGGSDNFGGNGDGNGISGRT